VTSTKVTLSASLVVLLLLNGWMGWELGYSLHVGIADVADVAQR
jgi:uncharacterized membrane protein